MTAPVPKISTVTLTFTGTRPMTAEIRIDGQVPACYVRIRRGEVAHTFEQVPGQVIVDVDAEGRLLGFELIGKVEKGTIRLVGEKYAPPEDAPAFERMGRVIEEAVEVG